MRRSVLAAPLVVVALLVAAVLVLEPGRRAEAVPTQYTGGWANVSAGDPVLDQYFGRFTNVQATYSGTNLEIKMISDDAKTTVEVTVGPPTGDTLTPGTQYHQARKPATAQNPLLDLRVNGKACTTTYGDFDLDALALSGNTVVNATVTWHQQCNSVDSPVASGQAWFQMPGGPLDGSPTGELIGVAPQRLLDTRSGLGVPGGGPKRLGPGESMEVQITNRGPIPATDVMAVLMNVTAVSPSAATYLKVYPKGASNPEVSNVNVTAGEIRPNRPVVKTGTDGMVVVYNFSGNTDVLIDVTGYFTPDGAGSNGRFRAHTPYRLYDSRNSTSFGPAETRVVPVVKPGSPVPANAVAAALNVTAVDATGPTYVTVFPGDAPELPVVSNLNVENNRPVPNLVVTRLGPAPERTVKVYNHANRVNVVVDVVGYFVADESSSLGRFVAMDPQRVIDTRDTGKGGAPLMAGGYGNYGIASWMSPHRYPFEISGVIMNTTVTNTTAGSWLSVFPAEVPGPLASNLNWVAGESRPNLVMVGLSKWGYAAAYNHAGQTDLVFDVAGWFSG